MQVIRNGRYRLKVRAKSSLPTPQGEGLELIKCSNPVIERVYRDLHRVGVYIPRDEGDYLYSLVRRLRPSITVEVGMANGISTLFLAQGLKDNGCGRHIAIDPFQDSEWGGAGIAAVREAGLDTLVELIQKPSHQALPELEQAGVVAQLIFIDGSHLFDYVMSDFLCADRILETGGMLAFDDSDWPAITGVIRFMLANRRYEVPFPEVIVEDPCFHPTPPGRALRALARAIPKLGGKLRPDFLVPSYDLGIRGRCVVLRKQGPDERDSQGRGFRNF